jgi:hypothetical protein
MKTLLVATTPEARDISLKHLGGHYEVIICLNMQDAYGALIGPVDLIACGIHFGDGAMYDLLRYAKALPDTKTIPFLSVNGAEAALSPVIRQSVEIATRALGADAFVELAQWRLQLGDDRAYEKMRGVINGLMEDKVEKFNRA